jgi:hypothetical protein
LEEFPTTGGTPSSPSNLSAAFHAIKAALPGMRR